MLDFIIEMESLSDNQTYEAALKALEIIGEDASQYQKDGEKPQKRCRAAKKANANSEPTAGQKTSQTGSGQPSDSVETDVAENPNPPIDVSLVLDHEHEFLARRNVSPEVAATFGIGHCRTGIMKNRIAVPIHNLQGELVAYTGRWTDETADKKIPKYKLPKGFEKSYELFNLHRAVEFGKPYVVVVEGIWSAIRLHIAGVPAVALLGTSVSDAQAALLAEAGFRHAVLILDGDEAGRAATPAVLQILSQTLYVKSLVLPEGVKPDTMDESIVSRLRR